ncbi:MAG: outer membrane lipoprotein-sorting protein, partial [Gammaproteobacteria bacterium]|nr:outer membrane lipoprotein-sorting protein [Gammaproteobacteria bacterium]
MVYTSMNYRFLFPLLLLALPAVSVAEDRDATQIVRDAVNHWRGLTSYTEMTMVIHRPDWERSMTMQAWTKGDDRSLVRV